MYDPQVGRFLEEDPSSFGAGDPNLYRYVGNSPTNATDPSGLDDLELDRARGNKHFRIVNQMANIYGTGQLTLGMVEQGKDFQKRLDSDDDFKKYYELYSAILVQIRLETFKELQQFGLVGPTSSLPLKVLGPGAGNNEYLRGDELRRWQQFVDAQPEPLSTARQRLVQDLLSSIASKLLHRNTQLNTPVATRFVGGFLWAGAEGIAGFVDFIASPDKAVEGIDNLLHDPKLRQALFDKVLKACADDSAEAKGALTFEVLSMVAGGGEFSLVSKGSKIAGMEKIGSITLRMDVEAVRRANRAKQLSMHNSKELLDAIDNRRVSGKSGFLNSKPLTRAEQLLILEELKGIEIPLVRGADKVLDQLDPNYGAGFNHKTGTVYLRQGVTDYEAFHEITHARQWKTLGKAEYLAKGKYAREKHVFDEIMKQKDRFSKDELLHAKNYIDDLKDRFDKKLID